MSMKNNPRHAIWGLLASAALLTGTAYAQEAEESEDESADGEIETVIVTGIRGSMQQSLERKRQADHFVDAITAEDIGAFPEQNLAEALQRVSGGRHRPQEWRGQVRQRPRTRSAVRADDDRRACCGRPTTHREATTAAGRRTRNPASSVSTVSSPGWVQAVEVHKSPRADHVEGGLGGFVDIQARKPLDLGERHIAFALDSTVNELADDTAPGVFALFSDTLSDTTGFMVSAQWDNRVFRSGLRLTVNGYINNPLPVV